MIEELAGDIRKSEKKFKSFATKILSFEADVLFESYDDVVSLIIRLKSNNHSIQQEIFAGTFKEMADFIHSIELINILNSRLPKLIDKLEEFQEER